MLFSIIVPTKNNERTIKKCLNSIVNQSYKNIEVIFVDNTSSDATFDIAKTYSNKLNIKLFQKGPERNIQRPFGFEKSSGDIVYFIDSDMYLEENLVQEAITLFEANKKLVGIIVPEENIGYSGYWTRVKAFERSLYDGDDTVEAARIFKRNVYKKVGGYNVNLISGEDWDLSDRVRKIGQIARIKSKVMHDEGIVKIGSLLKKKFYYGEKFINYTQNNSIKKAGSKIYFLRKSFYQKWEKYLKNLLLFPGLLAMLNLSLVSFSLGFFIGKLKKKFKKL